MAEGDRESTIPALWQESYLIGYSERWNFLPRTLGNEIRPITFPHVLKEFPMQYKTIMLELLKQHPELHERLRHQRKVLATMEHYAIQLKAAHEAWKLQLAEAEPGREASQIASEAMELALAELQSRLSSESLPEENSPLSLDEAMAYIKSHTSNA